MEFVAGEASGAPGNLAGRGAGTMAESSRLLSSTALTAAAFAGLVVTAPLFMAGEAQAQDRQWLGTAPGDSQNYFNAGNWNGADVPDTGGEAAVFQGVGSTTVNYVGAGSVSLDGIRFDPGAQAYTINLSHAASLDALLLFGFGIDNQSSFTQTINIDGAFNSGLALFGDADLRSNLTVNVNSFLQFTNTASGGSARIVMGPSGLIIIGSTTDIVTLGSLEGGGQILFSSFAGQVVEVGSLGLDTTYSGLIGNLNTGSGSLVKAGVGTLTLTGASSYTEGTTINGGTLRAANGNALGTGLVTLNGGTLAVDVSLGNNIGQTAASTIQFNPGTSTLGGTVDLGASNLTLNGTGTGVVAGTVSGTAASALTKSGTGTTILTAANSYAGGTTISAGTLQMNNAGALGSGQATLAGGTLRGNVTGTLTNLLDFDPGISTLSAAAGTILTQTGQLNVSAGALARFGTATDTGTIVIGAPVAGLGLGFDVEINGGTVRAANSILGRVTGDSIVSATSTTVALNAALDFNDQLAVVGNLLGAGTVMIGANPASVLDVGSGNFSGSIQGAGGLDVQDTERVTDGTLILSGTSSYTGGTTIQAGNTLLVNGSIASSSGLTVDLGGTVGGTGTLPDTIVNGTLSAGNSPGTLTVDGDLTLNAGSTSIFELATPGIVGGGVNDLVIVNGNLALDGTLQTPGAVSGFYRLFNVTGTTSGAFATVPAGGTVITTVPNQVNLLFNSGGQLVQFWDGADMAGDGTVDGGAGTWTAANTNWTGAPGNANFNAPWGNQVGVFAGTAGTVTVSGPVAFEGIQFSTVGYTITGDALTMTGDSAGNTAASFVNVDGGVVATIASALTGAAGIGLDKLGSGALVLTGTNTYTGGTTVSGGQLVLGAAGDQGSIVGAVVNNASFVVVNADTSGITSITSQGVGGSLAETGFLDGTTASSATIVNHNDGVTSFLGASTAANATIITNAGGFLQMFDTSTAASASISNQGVGGLAGQTVFRESSTAGSATITNSVDGITSFTETSTAANATIANNDLGLTNFFDTSTADRAAITNDDGFTQFFDTSTAANATITNSGSGTTTAGGRLIFFDTSAAGNATIVNNSFGNTEFAQNSTAANATITTNAGGVTTFSDNATAADATITTNAGGITYFGDDSTGGNARLTTNSGGSLDMSFLTSGGMTAGSIEGAGTFSLGSKLLSVGSNNLSTEVSGVIADGGENGGTGGALTKVGTGTLTLSGANTYTGATTVSAGTLSVNGSIANSVVSVLDGASLQGTGTLGGLSLAGTLAPGNSIGTLNVAGNATIGTGSIYEVEINAAGQSDRLAATGSVTLGGGEVVVLDAPGSYTNGMTYAIVTAAAGVTGTFAGVTDSLPLLDAILSYQANAVLLELQRNSQSLAGLGITPNQKATGAGLDSLGGGTLETALSGLGSTPEILAALDLLSGEVQASAKGAFIEESRYLRDAASARIRAAFGDVGATPMPVLGYGEGDGPAPAAADAPLAAWGQVLGAWGSFDGDGNAADFDRSTGGFLTGIDALVADNVRLGLIGGYTYSSFDVDDRASSGSANSVHLGVYGGTDLGNIGLRGGAAYTWHFIDTSRNAAFGGFAESLSADYDAATAQIFGEAGYRIDTASASFEPFANFAWVNQHTDGFSETGGAAALTHGSDDTDQTFTTLGIRASAPFSLGNSEATLSGMVGWRHAFNDVTPEATFSFAGGAPFVIAGTPIARDALALEAGFDVKVGARSSLGLVYSGQIGDGAQDHSAKATLTVGF